jgi:hypothetical protein
MQKLSVSHQYSNLSIRVFRTYGGARDVGQISTNTWSVDYIVKGELIDEIARFEKE